MQEVGHLRVGFTALARVLGDILRVFRLFYACIGAIGLVV